MRESYCGLCDECRLDDGEFLAAIAKVKERIQQFPIYWWRHCFPGEEGFSLPEFIKGLEWFLDHPECPGCKNGGGLRECPIRDCASQRQVAQCSDCSDQESCERFNIIMQGYPGCKIYLHRYSLRRNL